MNKLDYKSEQRIREQLKIPRFFDIIPCEKADLADYEGVKVGRGRYERFLHGFQTGNKYWWMIVRKPIMTCPACCNKTSLDVPNIEFRRFHNHDHCWQFHTGIQCTKCGYLIRVRKSEQYYSKKV